MNDKNQNYIKIYGLIALICIITAQSNIMSFKALDIQNDNNLNPSVLRNPIDLTYSSPISIDGNSELAFFIQDKGLIGNGTLTSPYIIEKFFISASSTIGIEIINTDAFLTIQNCYISGGFSNKIDGIYLQRTSNVKITNNTIINSYRGIFLRTSCNNNEISKNNITTTYSVFEFTTGIILYSDCNNNTIKENYVNNIRRGIELTDSDNSIISGNNVTYNVDAIELNNYCVNCTISRNNITYNKGEGVNLFASCTENTIFGNIISHNEGIGIEVWDDSNFNLIYFNDVYENEDGQAIERYDSIGNQWDNGTVGNYWGDYSDKYPNAKNNSVFWKTPYEIDGNDLGVDHFPLVNSIVKYKPLEGIKISGFPLVNILFFISAGVFLLKRKISR